MSNHDVWKRVNELVLAALEKSPEEWPVFLETSCGGDLALRREVESLLTAETEALRRVDRPALELLAPEADPKGLRIGAYEVVREIGRGGMGAVYLAARADDEFQRQVAIKVLKPGMNTDDLVRRFRKERQILANLQHPNIAELYEGGHTEDHLPYIIMEYVEGEPIDHYCDRRSLNVRQRLELFRKVCSAIELAHRNLVVHRDLKPSNILVNSDREPKLLDFGIAKLLEPTSFGAPTVTAFGRRLMTPEYASPEQVRGEAITTGSDVYSLGVLLYLLLTGHPPYRLTHRTEAEIRRAICDQEPERPSLVIQRTAETLSADGSTTTRSPQKVSQTREGDPAKLRRRLAGDLDNIVLMSLRKETQRRYASVEQLSEDIRRHLEGLPVQACKDTFSYRAGKFLRRHVKEVAAAAVILALVLSFAVDRELQQRRIAQERDRAQQVSAFLIDLFQVSDPGEARGNALTAREVLDAGAASIERELRDQPELQAALMNTIGQVYRNLGLYAAAEPLLVGALEQRRRVYDRPHGDVVESLDQLAVLRMNQDNLAAAEDLHLEALATGRRLWGEEHPLFARVINNYAMVVREGGKLDDAEPLFRQALEIRRRLLGDQHPEVAESLTTLALLLRDKDELADAEALLRQALALRRKLLGEHPDVALTANFLALVLRDRGDLEAAEHLFREVLELRRRIQGDNHPDVASSANNLATHLVFRGELDAAETLFREAIEVFRSNLGEDHRYVVTAMHNLAVMLRDKGDFEAAEPLAREVLATRRQILGDHVLVASSINNLANVLRGQGRYEDAEPLFREALALCHQHLGDKHRHVATAIHNLAVLLHDRGDDASAESLARQAIEMRRDLLGDEHPALALSLSLLGSLRLRQGKTETAESLAREALEILHSKLPAGHWQIAEVESLLGETLVAQHRFEEAEPLLVAGFSTIRERNSQPELRDARRRLLTLYQAWGRPLPPFLDPVYGNAGPP